MIIQSYLSAGRRFTRVLSLSAPTGHDTFRDKEIIGSRGTRNAASGNARAQPSVLTGLWQNRPKQLASQPTTYLVGELDILPLAGFDSSCPAVAQGPTRLARGLAFSKVVNDKLRAHQDAVIIPEYGHNARCMFTDEKALPIVFPK